MLGMENESMHNLELNRSSMFAAYGGNFKQWKIITEGREKIAREMHSIRSALLSVQKKRKKWNAPPLETCILHIHFVCRVENFRIIDCITSFGKDDDDNVERIFCVTK